MITYKLYMLLYLRDRRAKNDLVNILGVPYITANIYCKSRNLPHTDIRIYSIDLRLFLRHPVTDTDILMVLY